MKHANTTELEIAYKQVLGLKLPTDPRWVDMAEMHLQNILTDHAYCEQKATTTCISLVQKYADKPLLVQKLSPIVTEEWGHFRLVLEELHKRGYSLGSQRKDEYVNKLLKFIRRGLSKESVLLDRLIICAMIEARSCERFRLLSHQLKDKALRMFYQKLMISEAGHYKLFLDLASYYSSPTESRERWLACLQFEKEILKNVQVRGDRIH